MQGDPQEILRIFTEKLQAVNDRIDRLDIMQSVSPTSNRLSTNQLLPSTLTDPEFSGMPTAGNDSILIQPDIASTISTSNDSSMLTDHGLDRSIESSGHALRAALSVNTIFTDKTSFVTAINALAQNEQFRFTSRCEDNRGFLKFLCSRSGSHKTRSKLRNVRPSSKCGCKCLVIAKKQENDKFKITKSELVHTDGCVPGQAQLQAMDSRRGVELGEGILQQLVLMSQLGMSSRQLRKMCQLLHIDQLMDMSAASMRNLRIRISDAAARKNDDWIAGTNQGREMVDFIVSREQDGNQLSILNTLAAFNRQLNICAEEFPKTEDVSSYLEIVKEKIGVLDLKFVSRSDINNQVTALMWNIDYQCQIARQFGDVIFWDGTCNTNDLGWSLFAPTVITENGKLYPIAFGIVKEEKSNSSQTAMLQMMIELMPFLKKNCKTLFSDQGTSQQVIDKVFDGAKGLLCVWHLNLNIASNLSYCNPANVKIWFGRMVKAPTEILLNSLFDQFKKSYKDNTKVLKYFTDRIWEHRKRWARVFTMKTLTFGYGSNLSESMNSSMKAWMPPLDGRRTPSVTVLISSLIYYALEHQRNMYDGMCKFEIDHNRISHDRTANTGNTFINTIKRDYGTLCSENVVIQYQLSANYVFSSTLNEDNKWNVWIVDATNGAKIDFQTVLKQANGLLKCSCDEDTSFGWPCRHTLRILFLSDNCSIENWKRQIDDRWKRRQSTGNTMKESDVALSIRGSNLLQNNYDYPSDDDNNSLDDFDINPNFNSLESNLGDEGTEYRSQPRRQLLSDKEAKEQLNLFRHTVENNYEKLFALCKKGLIAPIQKSIDHLLSTCDNATSDTISEETVSKLERYLKPSSMFSELTFPSQSRNHLDRKRRYPHRGEVPKNSKSKRKLSSSYSAGHDAESCRYQPIKGKFMDMIKYFDPRKTRNIGNNIPPLLPLASIPKATVRSKCVIIGALCGSSTSSEETLFFLVRFDNASTNNLIVEGTITSKMLKTWLGNGKQYAFRTAYLNKDAVEEYATETAKDELASSANVGNVNNAASSVPCEIKSKLSRGVAAETLHELTDAEGLGLTLKSDDDNEGEDVQSCTYNVNVDGCTIRFDFTPNQLASCDGESFIDADVIKAFALAAVKRFNNDTNKPFVVLDPCIMEICNKQPKDHLRRAKFISLVDAAKKQTAIDIKTPSNLIIPFCFGKHFNLWHIQERRLDDGSILFDRLDIYDSTGKIHPDHISTEEYKFIELLIRDRDDDNLVFQNAPTQTDTHSCGLHTLNNLLKLITNDVITIDRTYLKNNIST